MIRFLFALLFLITPQSLLGQQIAIRSGEHGDFTRLVFDVLSDTSWKLTHVEGSNTVRLSLTTVAKGFNTGAAFEKIDRSRILNLTPAPNSNEIDIQLACDCKAEVFLLRKKMLVVDIKPNIVSDLDVAVDRDLIPKDEVLTSSEPRMNVAEGLTKIWLGPSPRLGPQSGAIASPPFSFDLTSDLENRDEFIHESEEDSTRGIAIRSQIFGDIANAATQGLLDRPQHLRRPPEMVKVEPDSSDGESLDLVLPERIDRNSSSDGRISIGGQSCTNNQNLKIGSWVTDDSEFNLSLSTRRSAMFEEFDRINQNAQSSYVRSLLFFGFGAEARSVAMMGDRQPNRLHLALSYLIDGEADPSRFFRNQLECDSYAAMWAVLDGSELDPRNDLNEPYVLQAFEGLPKHLRLHLGPILASNLLEKGYPDVAKSVLRRLERANGGETDSILLGKANIELQEGNDEVAKKAFTTLSTLNVPETAAAIASSVEIARENGEQVSDRIVELSAAFSTELRNTNEGPELWQAHLRSLVLNGRYDDAFDVLDNVEGVPKELVDTSLGETIDLITRQAEDLAFLKYYFDKIPEKSKVLEGTTILAAAKRVLGLGLPKAAIKHLEGISDPSLDREVRVLRAEALIQMSKPEDAEILLIGLTGDRVARLRAQARSQMGDHAYAKNIYKELGDEPEELKQAWLSGDWESVAEKEESPLSIAAQMAKDEWSIEESNSLTLGDFEHLSAESSQARQTILGMLEATRIEERN